MSFSSNVKRQTELAQNSLRLTTNLVEYKRTGDEAHEHSLACTSAVWSALDLLVIFFAFLGNDGGVAVFMRTYGS
jgi:hypothetical protein